MSDDDANERRREPVRPNKDAPERVAAGDLLPPEVAKAGAGELPPGPDVGPCGCPRFDIYKARDGVEYCTGRWHYIGRLAKRPAMCPAVEAAEVRERIAGERGRLRGELRLLRREGFDGFDPALLTTGGHEAIDAMRRFAEGPERSVLLVGPSGLGKTHLFLAAHFRLLERGLPSIFVQTRELRMAFKDAESYDDGTREDARARIDRLVRARVVIFDDVAGIEGDERKRGTFADGLKDLLDRRHGVWAVGTNREGEEAERHPDLTAAIMSRLLHGCELVEMSGPDQRRADLVVRGGTNG